MQLQKNKSHLYRYYLNVNLTTKQLFFKQLFFK